MKSFILFTFLFSNILTSTEARISDGKTQTILSDGSLTIKVDREFHLNKDAPAKLKITSSKKNILPSLKDEKEFTFALGDLKNFEAILEYYVCDNKNTTCEQHKEHFSVANNLITFQIISPESKALTLVSPTNKTIINNNKFIVDNLEAGKTKAKKESKLLFVDFSAPWCPACLRLETEVFGEKLFHEKTRQLIKVTLNIDLDVNKESVEKYKVTVIPTMIIMNDEGIELGRIIDFRETKNLIRDITKTEKRQNIKSYEEYLALAQKNNKEAILHLAHRAFEMYDHKEALNWFKKLNEENLFFAASDIYVEEAANSKTLSKSYLQYINKYKDSFDSIVWRIELAKLFQSQSSNDLSTETKLILQDNIILINKALANKNFQQKIFTETAQGLFKTFETEELYSKLIETYHLLKKTILEQSAISKLKEIISKHPLTTDKTGEVLTAMNYMKAAKMSTEVENWFIKLIKANPLSDYYPRNLANFYFKEKNYALALPVAEQAVRLGGHYLFKSYLLLARIQKELNLKSESIATASKALGLKEAKDPENKENIDLLKAIVNNSI